MTQPVLDIQQLHLSFPGFNGDVHALNNVSLQINRGEIVGLVGESGSGKSVTAMLIMRLLPTGSYCVHRGQISLLGDDVLNAREKQLRQWRGARVAMIFQEPMTALNPTRRIGLQMMDVIRHHQPISRREARAKAIVLLEEMQIPDAVEVMSRYPFELSGGMRQRVMRALAEELAVQVGIRPEYLDRLPHAFSGGQRQRIAIARALSSQPDVIVLDEPTSALDISVQAQILNLLVTLQENHGLTYVLISHNVSVIRHMSDRVAVMYLGQIVELGDAQQVLTAPAHPYTRLLLDSLPAIDKPLEEEWALRKTDLPGNRTLPQGCFFYERCPLATSGCEVRQSLAIREDGRELRCWRAL
ncbi:ABC transporter ATP-binding protein [Shigella dysenteriae]|uniref:ABC transporter ATP-binding protein n=1 Tax=Shigella dysenteriae TaxID=622 RepID=UPI0001F672AC|nr:ABC transporter ATP-binding protein [Shigella dysenteriae]ELH2123152.1 ABC transporter ATP-binding protein [Shigella flexneri]ELP8856933.1 ABC transporter ATP-binding protein [Escherichia coli]EFV8086309.1 ATP-binding cassette domain-containing protein [Shigella dysenteriae]EFW51537.1 ABC transporter, ATP-binding protein [Shigella dysenteriae CDC 74-1112]EFW7979813.1 ABC transporter ATP-binding protein [Shigella dysenteriae]